ncbi:alpha/beta hydrolase [Treponema sp.]|uniref:alpha/beta hydrolase n=1 Tax=Treponema sp. TaxID=166 RepID=UPI00388ED173
MIHETLKLKKNKDISLTTYILDNYPKFSAERKRPLVLVIPGGGYSHFGQREQEAVAVKMNSLGFHSAVLHYSLAPMKFPDALCDLAAAVAQIRLKADDWNVDSDKIILCGFSAGGHLAASLGCFWNSQFLQKYTGLKSEQIRPDYLCLCYPVVTADKKYCHEGSIQNVIGSISEDKAAEICKSLNQKTMRDVISIEKNITSDFPPAFIWHTLADEAVPAKNTLLLADALYENKIECEYHLFNRGKHALALATKETANPDGTNAEYECSLWPELFKNWFEGV